MPLLAVCKIPSVTGLPADAITNSWAIATSGAVAASDLDEVAVAVGRFYGVAATVSGNALGQYLSPVLSRTANACTVTLYDLTGHLDGSPHGSPLQTGATFTIASAGGSGPLPSECAVVLSLEAVNRAGQQIESATGTRPRSRYSGKVYIGPLAQAAVTNSGGIPRVNGTLNSLLGDELVDRMHDELNAIPNVDGIGVWSRADAVVRVIDNVSVDDAFDTQRRRGERASARTRYTV